MANVTFSGKRIVVEFEITKGNHLDMLALAPKSEQNYVVAVAMLKEVADNVGLSRTLRPMIAEFDERFRHEVMKEQPR